MPFPKIATIPAPKAQNRPTEISQIGRTRHDDYAWLKDENWREVMSDPAKLDPDIRSYLEAENVYCAQIMSGTADLQTALFEEIKGRIKDDDSSVPSLDGDFAYSH
ncbi:MAG: S9 family peptidase, partial [Robiginitomaculum sp.]